MVSEAIADKHVPATVFTLLRDPDSETFALHVIIALLRSTDNVALLQSLSSRCILLPQMLLFILSPLLFLSDSRGLVQRYLVLETSCRTQSLRAALHSSKSAVFLNKSNSDSLFYICNFG